MWAIATALLIIVVIFLVIKLSDKQKLDESEVIQLNKQIKDLTNEYQEKQKQLDEFISKRRNDRIFEISQEMAKHYENEKRRFKQDWEKFYQEEKDRHDLILNDLENEIADERYKQQQIVKETEYQNSVYESLLAPLKQYEKERQEKLFYTIQVPDEYKDDINYLLINVAPKVQHPDIINKLIWAEYIKPYIEETFKRVGIESKPGIYKLTNLDSGKAYIGKSTDIKKRIADHIKSSIGIKSIADQAVHHEILKTGFWNWTLEYIIYCDKDQLSELEKYYIDFFKTQDFGYNRNSGG